MNAKNFTLGLLIIFGGLFAWEHGARKMSPPDSDVARPSWAIMRMADVACDVFEWCGIQWAWVSSFYTHINLEDLGMTLHELASPSIKLVTSPLFAVKGYLETIDLYDHPYVIVAGSVTLVAVVCWAVDRVARRWGYHPARRVWWAISRDGKPQTPAPAPAPAPATRKN